MTLIYENDLSDPHDLLFCDGTAAEVVEWQGRRALRLNGLAVIPAVSLTEGHIEVQIGAEGAAYPGIAFRVADVANNELAYAQPHTSGLWDAIHLKDTEYLGWGLIVKLRGNNFKLLPASLG